MVDFEVPTSTYLSAERIPPEVEQLAWLLTTALEVVPDIAPLLVVGAVTGMRRGELVGIRRSRVIWALGQITVDSAISEAKKVKGPKTRRKRTFHVDAGTMAMLRDVCDEMELRAASAGVAVCEDPFVFSLDADCSRPLPPDYFTKRVGVLKSHLSIEDKRAEVANLEDEALRLRRQPPRPRPAGMTGPASYGGLSYREIGEQLDRSERWAAMAVQTAERREKAKAAGLDKVNFDGSILAFAEVHLKRATRCRVQHQHGRPTPGTRAPGLARHYSKSRASAARKTAEHLGRMVHGDR